MPVTAPPIGPVTASIVSSKAPSLAASGRHDRPSIRTSALPTLVGSVAVAVTWTADPIAATDGARTGIVIAGGPALTTKEPQAVPSLTLAPWLARTQASYVPSAVGAVNVVVARSLASPKLPSTADIGAHETLSIDHSAAVTPAGWTASAVSVMEPDGRTDPAETRTSPTIGVGPASAVSAPFAFATPAPQPSAAHPVAEASGASGVAVERIARATASASRPGFAARMRAAVAAMCGDAIEVPL